MSVCQDHLSSTGGCGDGLLGACLGGARAHSGGPAWPGALPSTGAGKTHTMLGMDAEPGIYLRTLSDLFRAIETCGCGDCSVSMSYLEVSHPLPPCPVRSRVFMHREPVSPPDPPCRGPSARSLQTQGPVIRDTKPSTSSALEPLSLLAFVSPPRFTTK